MWWRIKLVLLTDPGLLLVGQVSLINIAVFNYFSADNKVKRYLQAKYGGNRELSLDGGCSIMADGISGIAARDEIGGVIAWDWIDLGAGGRF